jgi:hypothetical protein
MDPGDHFLDPPGRVELPVTGTTIGLEEVGKCRCCKL